MHNEIEATIQLDTLVLCCISTVENNFNHAIQQYFDEAYQFSHSFGNTILTQSNDDNRRYKYCYNVSHNNKYIGKIKFGSYGQPHQSDKVWFSIHNKVFYNNTLKYLPTIFENLHLQLNNITRAHIALDAYNFDFEQTLRRNLKNKENKVKLIGRNIKDRKKTEKRIIHYHSGSLDNPFKIRSIYLKNKRQVNYSKQNSEYEEKNKEPKTTIELVAYNKLEEININSPHKTYILDYHKAHNPKYKNIHREEIRLESEEIGRYEKKYKKSITLTDLLDKKFLYSMFSEYLDRIIVIRDSKNKKIDLLPNTFLGSLEGILPLTLPASVNLPNSFEIDNETKELNFLNENNLPIYEIDNKEIINKKSIYRYNKNMSQIMRKRQLSQETRNRISNSMKGARNPNFGKPLSDEHREKIRNSMLNYWNSNL